jgi:hypothetical protein
MNRTIKSILAIITASSFAFCVSVMAQGKGGGGTTGATTGAQNAGGPAQIQPVTDGASNELNAATTAAGDKNPDKKNMGANGGADKQPLTGADKQPLTGADKQPLTGAEKQPLTGAEKQPLTGADKQPLTGADKQPVDDNQATGQLNSATSGGKKVPDKKSMGTGKP